MVTKICEYCGREFKVIDCRKDTAKFCCRDCSDKSKLAKNNMICDYCGKPYHRKKSHTLNHSIGNFCCRECFNKAKEIAYKGEGNHQYGLKGELNASFKSNELERKNHNLIDIEVYMPEHPYARRDRVKKHRLLIEQNYKNYNQKYFETINGMVVLKSEIDVHHIDFNHSNNSIDNLMPCTKSEHRKIHNKNREIIRDIKGRITAVLKHGELLGSLEVGNQQPSTPLKKCEGSETNS